MRIFVNKMVSVVVSAVLFVSIFANISICSVGADAVLTSSDISVVGFQMKTNVTSSNGVAFRAICKSPDKGSILTVNGKDYTVINFGTIYTKDPNRSGDYDKNVLNKSYTELDTTPYPQSEKTQKYGFKYIGRNVYERQIVTFGYLATDIGVLEQKDNFTSYVRTMFGVDNYITNALYVRPFVEAKDEEENSVIIYGEYASKISVAEIAYKVYTQNKAPNEEGHKYLYDKILSQLPETNPFYLDKPIEYGWGGVVDPN